MFGWSKDEALATRLSLQSLPAQNMCSLHYTRGFSIFTICFVAPALSHTVFPALCNTVLQSQRHRCDAEASPWWIRYWNAHPAVLMHLLLGEEKREAWHGQVHDFRKATTATLASTSPPGGPRWIWKTLCNKKVWTEMLKDSLSKVENSNI